jgi:predicted AAA+ superfamily ATPase
MELLMQHQASLLSKVEPGFTRYLFDALPWQERFLGIKGLRGVGKTTMLLQHLKFHLHGKSEHLYVTLDHPYFYNHTLFELAQAFYKLGGKTLLVDEVHKLPNWSRELKIIYDGMPDLQVVFTASSALDIYRGESDLSRRVLSYTLGGLSFREYLQLFHGVSFPAIPLNELLTEHSAWASDIMKQIKPLALFKTYLVRGYFPFGHGQTDESFEARLLQTIEVVMNEDLAFVEGYSADHIYKIKKLLGVLAETTPFTVNIASMANKLGIGRNTVTQYLHAMAKAGILNFLNREGKGFSQMQKPDKLFPENTNFSHALRYQPDKGTVGETFLVNQLKNAGFALSLPDQGDILVHQKQGAIVLEIGGKDKKGKQVDAVPNSYIVADDIESGYLKKIPLYLFGFLY